MAAALLSVGVLARVKLTQVCLPKLQHIYDYNVDI